VTPRVLLLVASLAASAASGADDSLGRLFFTPGERARLDASRGASAAPAEDPPAPETPTPDLPPALPMTPPAPVAVNGLVRRERGPSTAWINGAAGTRADLAPTAGKEVRIGRHAVEVTDSADTRARVKPGQIFDPAQGRVVEAFEHRTPPQRPTPPAP